MTMALLRSKLLLPQGGAQEFDEGKHNETFAQSGLKTRSILDEVLAGNLQLISHMTMT